MKMLLKLVAGLVAVVIIALVGFRYASAWRETDTVETLMPENGRLVETDYGKIHVSEWGKANTRTVVMTHGMAAWGGLWTDVAESLAQGGYHVVAVDEAPFGFSDAAHEDFTTRAEGERVVQMMQALGLQHALLVGHSFGGGVALEAALQNSALFDGLVLVCPVTKLGQPDAGTSKTAPLPLRSTPIAEALMSATVTNPMMTRLLLSRFMERKDMITDAEIAILQRPITRQGNTHAMAVWLRQFMQGSPDAKTADPIAATKLKMPIAFIWGDKDSVVPLPESARLMNLLGATKLDVIPGVGHMPQLEAPEDFKRLLRADLDAMPGFTQ
jgi:pimeloyl-ACP methyl ester carboxylesterase